MAGAEEYRVAEASPVAEADRLRCRQSKHRNKRGPGRLVDGTAEGAGQGKKLRARRF